MLRHHASTRGLAALVLIGGFAASSLPHAAHAAGAVASYTFTPSPIGSSASTPVSTAVTVKVVARDSTAAAVPAATIYVVFKQATGGGNATVGATRLKVKPQAFIADAAGTVTITYTTPAVYPTAGSDELTAENGPTVIGSTVKARDAFSFSSITAMSFSPHPIARVGTLLPGATVTLTLTVSKGVAPAANTQVWLSVENNTGGGTFAAGTTALTSSAVAVTTDSAGHVTVTYTAAATKPASGVDVVTAQTAPSGAGVKGRDEYKVA